MSWLKKQDIENKRKMGFIMDEIKVQQNISWLDM